MADFYAALGTVAPFYNLALVIITIALFAVLFNTPSRKAFMRPWHLFFACICLFIAEEVLTIARAAGMLKFIPQHFNAFFEFAIIIIFIYIVLIQKEYVKKHHL